MSQAGFTPIITYHSTTAAAVPAAGNLAPGEMALNIADMKLYAENSSGVVTLLASSSGASGDVVGPASATDNAVTRFDGTTGKLVQNSGVTIDDSNNVSGVAQLNATTADLTNIEVTNIKAKDGTAAGSIADSTGVVTLASSVLTTTDINGGTIDNTAIGGSTAAAGAFTTLTTSSTVTHNGGTANGVAFLDGSKVLTTGSALTFDGSTFLVAPYFKSSNSINGLFDAVYTGTTAGNSLGKLRFYGSGSGVTGEAAINGNLDGGSTTSANLSFYVGSGSEAMRLTSTGLGIGTSSPSTFGKLAVYGSGTAPVIGAFLGSNSPTTGATLADISFGARTDGTVTAIIRAIANDNGNGTDGQLTFWTADNTASAAATEKMRLDSSGNLGLGVTPSAWNSAYRALQIGAGSSLASNTSAKNVYLSSNTVYDTSAAFKYIASDYATQYEQYLGKHIWYTAPSGTAGNVITFTQAMTLDASGNLVVGTTTADSARLTVMGGSGGITLDDGNGRKLKFDPPGSINSNTAFIGTTTPHGLRINSGTSTNEGTLIFSTENTERARIDSSGNLLVGTTTSTGKVSIVGNSSTAAMLTVVNQSSPTTAASVGIGTTQAASASAIALAIQYGNGSAVTDNSLFIYTNGNVVNTNNSYGAFSDSKLKENVTDATPKLEKLNQVRIVNFNIIGSEQKQLGVIAQELEQIFPGMVDESPDRDAEGNDLGTTTKSVKYSVFVPMLIKAIQEQQAIIDSLKSRLDAAGL